MYVLGLNRLFISVVYSDSNSNWDILYCAP